MIDQMSRLLNLLVRKNARLVANKYIRPVLTTMLSFGIGGAAVSLLALFEARTGDQRIDGGITEATALQVATGGNLQEGDISISFQASDLLEMLISAERERVILEQRIEQSDRELAALALTRIEMVLDPVDFNAAASVTLTAFEGDPGELLPWLTKQADEQERELIERQLEIASLSHFMGENQAAINALTKVFASAPDDINARNMLGRIHTSRGELDQAESAFMKVLTLAGEDKTWQAVANGNLASIYNVRGDLEESEKYYREAIELYELMGSKAALANQYGNLGNIYLTRRDLDTAEEYHMKALVIHELLGSQEGMAADFGNLGLIYQMRGNLDLTGPNREHLDRAEEYYAKSLALSEAFGGKERIAQDYGNLGNIYLTRGDLDRAEEYVSKALALSEALGSKVGMASQYGSLGDIYSTRGDLEEAEEYYKRALAITEALGSKEGMAGIYEDLASLAKQRGDFKTARGHWTKSLDLYKQLGDETRIESVQFSLDMLDDGPSGVGDAD